MITEQQIKNKIIELEKKFEKFSQNKEPLS
jgi:hypothetical protein